MKKFAAKNIIIIISFILTAIFIFTFLSPPIRQLQIAQASVFDLMGRVSPMSKNLIIRIYMNN